MVTHANQKHSTGKNEKANMMFVLDKKTTKILSSCMRANELIDNGIIAIESIYVSREAVPTYPAIYFLDNSNPNDYDSTHLLVNDFREGNQQYQLAYVYYTSPITEELMDILIDGNMVDRLGALCELNVNFNTVENRVFTLNDPYPLPFYYWSDKNVIKSHMRYDIAKLVSLCSTLNIKPKIRYDAKSLLSQRFSELLQKALVQKKQTEDSWVPDTRAQILIVDRGIDVITPLMHEFTYQAALYDVCGNKGDTIFIDNENLTSEQKINPDRNAAWTSMVEKRSVVISDLDDPLWSKYRHEHIGVVGTKLSAELKRFKKDNKMAQYQDAMTKQRKKQGVEEEDAKVGDRDDLSPQQMAEALQDFHRYTHDMTRFSKHTELSKEVIAKIEANKLKDIALLEQELVTGYTEDGDSISKKKVMSKLSQLCADPKINTESKLRMVMVYLLTQGDLPAMVRKELLRNVDAVCTGAIDRLESLGYAVNKSDFQPPKYSSIRRKEGDARSEEIQLMRYVPLLWELGNLLVLNKLKDDAFPYVEGSAGGDEYQLANTSRRGKRGGATSEDDAHSNKPFSIIYVIGGITYSEAKSINEIATEHNCNVLLGGSVMLTPRQFLCNLADVTKYTWLQYAGPVLGENYNDIKNTSKFMKSLYKHTLKEGKDELEDMDPSDIGKRVYHDLDDGYDNVAIIGRNKDTLRHADDSILSISEIAEAELDNRIIRTTLSDKMQDLLKKKGGRKTDSGNKSKVGSSGKGKAAARDDDDDDIELGLM